MSDDDEIAEDQRDIDPDGEIAQRRALRKQTRVEREQEEEDRAWRQMLATKPGRRAIYNLLSQSKLWIQPFAVGPNGFPQPEATMTQFGERELARRIHDTLQILDYAAVYAMMCECDSRFKKAVPPESIRAA